MVPNSIIPVLRLTVFAIPMPACTGAVKRKQYLTKLAQNPLAD